VFILTQHHQIGVAGQVDKLPYDFGLTTPVDETPFAVGKSGSGGLKLGLAGVARQDELLARPYTSA
jgi:hypothetical protein